jgi:hypothetical protein
MSCASDRLVSIPFLDCESHLRISTHFSWLLKYCSLFASSLPHIFWQLFQLSTALIENRVSRHLFFVVPGLPVLALPIVGYF